MKLPALIRTLLPALMVGVLIATALPASASVDKQLAWKDCTSGQSGLRVKSTYTVDAQLYKAGTYYISIDIRWDLYKGGGSWRREDNHKITSAKFAVKKRNVTYWVTNGDRTDWSNAFTMRWRAHVISKLKKVRRGPDRTITTEERYYHKGMFAERGSNCVEWTG